MSGAALSSDARGADTAAPEVPEQRSGAEEEASAAAPADVRGRTAVPDRVVEKIAAWSAWEVPGVRSTSESGPLGGARRVRARADSAGGTVRIALAIAIAYPLPARCVATAVRERVTERVGTLTGIDVARVDIDIIELVGTGRVG